MIQPTCPHCDEPIAENDDVRFITDGSTGEDTRFHAECVLRVIVGSVGHQKRNCSCYGRVDMSEEGLTKREAARRADEWFRTHYILNMHRN
jgi:hypothetical protein